MPVKLNSRYYHSPSVPVVIKASHTKAQPTAVLSSDQKALKKWLDSLSLPLKKVDFLELKRLADLPF